MRFIINSITVILLLQADEVVDNLSEVLTFLAPILRVVKEIHNFNFTPSSLFDYLKYLEARCSFQDVCQEVILPICL
jgi:hypothetical protein